MKGEAEVAQRLCTKIKERKWEIVVFIMLYIVVFITTITYNRTRDDIVWMEMMEQKGGIIKYWLYGVKAWQPRYPAIFMGLVFAKFIWIWKIINPLIYTVSIFAIYKIFELNSKKKQCFIFIVSAAFLIYIPTMLEANVWLAGTSVYNLGFCSLILSMIPLIRYSDEKKIGIPCWMFCFAFSLCATWQEQPSVILSGLSIMIVVTKIFIDKRVNRKDIVVYFYVVWVTMNTVVFNLLNLSSGRVNGEKHWIPEYDMLSSIDKVFTGVNYGNYHVIYLSRYLFLLCCIFSAVLIYRKYSTKVRYIGFVPLVYSLGACIPLTSLLKGDEYVAQMVEFLYGGIANQTTYSDFNINCSTVFSEALIPSAIALLMIAWVGMCQFLCFTKVQEKIIAVSCYGLGLAVSYVLAFTGAFYGIITRSAYYTDMMLLVVFAMLLREYLKNDYEKDSKLLKVMKWALPCLGMVYYITYLIAAIKFS